MNKSLLYIAAFSTIAVGCSDQEVFNEDNLDQEKTLQPIEIFSGLETRGTGTIGSDNKWNNDIVKIFMLQKGTTNATIADYDLAGVKSGDKLFYNTALRTPDISESTASGILSNGTKYYPMNNAVSDFWGYCMDDDAVKSDFQVTDSTIAIDFEIDGSQDILVAKACGSNDAKASNMYKSMTAANKTKLVERSYSAYSSRRGVIPTMTFAHLLSRLTFTLNTGDSIAGDASKGIEIDSVKIKSISKGTLTLVNTKVTDNQDVNKINWIKWNNEQQPKTFYLKNRTKAGAAMTLLSPVSGKWSKGKSISQKLGEAILVAPAKSYEMTISVRQKASNQKYEYNAIIAQPKESDTFQAGKTYNIDLTIYSTREVGISATLDPWSEGSNISVTPEVSF